MTAVLHLVLSNVDKCRQIFKLYVNSKKIRTYSNKSMNLFNMKKKIFTYLLIGQFFYTFVNNAVNNVLNMLIFSSLLFL